MTEQPAPPYDNLPPRFQNVPYDQLPPTLQRRVRDIYENTHESPPDGDAATESLTRGNN
jgi:hypothetical protein